MTWFITYNFSFLDSLEFPYIALIPSEFKIVPVSLSNLYIIIIIILTPKYLHRTYRIFLELLPVLGPRFSYSWTNLLIAL
jgi:hypothetical protein